MLGAATVVTVTVQGQAKGTSTAADLLAEVVDELVNLPLTVLASSIDGGNQLYNAATFQWFHYNYTASVTVSTPSDTYDTIDDVALAVRSAFEDIAGSTPTAAQAVRSGVPQLGAPAGSGVIDSIAAAVHFDVAWIVLLVLGVVVLAIVAIGWGKNNVVIA